MWLYVPLAFAAESAGLTSACDLPAPTPELFVMSNGTPTPRASSWHGWKARPWIALLSGATCLPSRASSSVAEWILSLAGSPANPTPLQGRPLARKTAGTSGQQLFDFCETSEPEPCSLKTSPGSRPIPTAFAESLKTLPRWGGMRSGECFPAEPWAPRTDERGCSSWPTPTASAYGSNQGGAAGRTGALRPSLDTTARAWATPTASGGGRSNPPGTTATGRRPDGKKAQIDLSNQVKNWPTPRANQQQGGDRQKDGSITPNLLSCGRDWPTPKASDMDRGSGGSRKSPALPALIDSGLRDKSQTDGETLTPASAQQHLNTTFVEWLMGFPPGWSSPTATESTAYDAWATRFHHQLQQWLGTSLQGGR